MQKEYDNIILLLGYGVITMKSIVRLFEIELDNFKNIKHGLISMQATKKIDECIFTKKAEILGIYGQNGSGKTSVIDAIGIIQKIMDGESLREYDVINLMDVESKESKIRVRFTLDKGKFKGLIDYSVVFRKNEYGFEIYKEEIQYKEFKNDKFARVKSLVKYASDDVAQKIYPEETNSYFTDMGIDIAISKEIAKKDLVSFIFGEYGIRIFLGDRHEYNILKDVISSLKNYAGMDLVVINNERNGLINGNILVPLNIKLVEKDCIEKGEILVFLNGTTNVPARVYEALKILIENLNIVLSQIIPELSIELVNLGKEILKDGSEGYRVTLVSLKNGTRVPLKYESSGIIRIISILNIMIHVYNDPTMTLVIDEFDSGIYEFLLGELLQEFEKNAKGQLIFTSHNLRALEMLDKNSIIFSTTNESNKFIRLKNIKNNNLREMYLRSILLGGQVEDIYEETNSAMIGLAFRNAWKGMKNE